MEMGNAMDLDYEYKIGTIYQTDENKFELILKIYSNDTMLTYPILRECDDDINKDYVKAAYRGHKSNFYIGYKEPSIKNIDDFNPVKPYPIGHVVPEIFNKLQLICYNWLCNGKEYEQTTTTEIPVEKNINIEDIDIKSTGIIELSKMLNISIEDASALKIKMLKGLK